jgi:predicted metal-dependent peptidase
MNKEAHDKMVRGRVALYIKDGFYGPLSMRFLMKERKSCKTARISHTTIFYNPDFIDKLEEHLMPSLFAHEVQHCMLNHIDRCGGRNPRKWNQAGDYVINANLKRDGYEIGESWLFNQAYSGMSTDEIYNLLPDQDDGDESGDGDGAGDPLDEMEPGDPKDIEEKELEWKIATIQAAEAAKLAGCMPASMERLVEKLTTNQVSWRERLRRFATEHAKDDSCWSRPDRRMLSLGYIFPSLYSENVGLIVNDIDTSGSINQATLDTFGAEITAIKHQVRPQKMVNIYCDSAINKVDEFGEFDEPDYIMCGGGGTDFRPPFAYVAEKGLKPTCMIYLTDGYGPFPTEPPPYPVMWVMTTDVVAPFGETIRINT